MKPSLGLSSVSASPSGPVTAVNGRSHNIQKHAFTPISFQSRACHVLVWERFNNGKELYTQLLHSWRKQAAKIASQYHVLEWRDSNVCLLFYEGPPSRRCECSVKAYHRKITQVRQTTDYCADTGCKKSKVDSLSWQQRLDLSNNNNKQQILFLPLFFFVLH